MNFVEIGTCDYDTLIDSPYFDGKGIVVEPIKKYLDRLPKKENVKYLNFAIDPSVSGNPTTKDMYIIPEDTPNVPAWTKSCNSLLDSHPTLEHFQYDHLVEKIPVSCVGLNILYEEIDFMIHVLKIDTEGMDFSILKHWDFKSHRPLHIIFESKLMNGDELNYITNLLGFYKYTVYPDKSKDYNLTPYNHVAISDIL